MQGYERNLSMSQYRGTKWRVDDSLTGERWVFNTAAEASQHMEKIVEEKDVRD